MKDLFNSTNFIKFEVLETILNSSDIVNKLLSEEKSTLDDYLSNIDSYLYGLVLLPKNDTKKVKTWIKNYILHLYIPIIEKDTLYIVKSRFVSEIFKLKTSTSRIDDSLKNYLLNNIYKYLKNTINSKEDELQIRLNNIKHDELYLDYLQIYYDIYSNKEYIKNIYIDNEKLRNKMNDLFDFLR